MSRSIIYRPINKHEQYKAIELWQNAFEPKADGYFERYFSATASPQYQEGDTLGAWSDDDDDLLVSIVHIRRMNIRSSDNGIFLCGVISNVATRAEFRNQGLSQQLLQQAIDKMQRDGFDFSMLGTGRSNHYLKLAWQPMTMRIQYVMNIPDNSSSPNSEGLWVSASSISFYDQLFELYSNHPRPNQCDRYSSSMFEHWMGWHWQDDAAYICMLPNQKGYIVISQPDGKGSDVCVSEWRASDVDAERTLLNMAAAEIRRRYRRHNFLLHTLPQYTTLESFGWNTANLVFEENEDIMIRNIRLSDDLFHDIKRTFEASDGKATIWPGEYY